MKGQNLAVETVFTVGLGIAIATGIVTVFSQYRTDISDTATEKQTQLVASKLNSNIHSLEAVDEGEKVVSLPEEMGSSGYTVEIGDHITITASNEEHTYPLNGISSRLSVSGSASGGTVKVYKSEDQIRLLED